MKLITPADVIVAYYAGRHPVEIAASLGTTLDRVLNEIDVHLHRMRNHRQVLRTRLSEERRHVQRRLREERDRRREEWPQRQEERRAERVRLAEKRQQRRADQRSAAQEEQTRRSAERLRRQAARGVARELAATRAAEREHLRERARKLERNHPDSDAVFNPPRYLPTEEEIYAQCEAIQATWSAHERKVRWLIAHSVEDSIGQRDSRRGWAPQMMREADLCGS